MEVGIVNRCNGKMSKTVQTGNDPIERDTPRNRADSVESEIIKAANHTQ